MTMNRLAICIFCLLTTLLISACGQKTDDSVKSKYQELGWEELKPYDEPIIEQDPLDADDDWYTDGYGQGLDLRGMYSGAPPQAYSVGVVSEVDGKNIRVPGFIVPLEFEAGNLVKEFFLVPYFGACFHKPPPPPNQTIYVSSAVPVEYESIYDPVWIMGAIKIEQTDNDIATAAYSMNLHLIEPYLE